NDTALFTGNRSQYDLTLNPTTGVVTVSDLVSGRDGTDTLTGVETLQFSDQTVALPNGSPPPAPALHAALRFAGGGLISGTGHDLENAIVESHNFIGGKIGVDALIGGAGADTFVFPDLAERVSTDLIAGTDKPDPDGLDTFQSLRTDFHFPAATTFDGL